MFLSLLFFFSTFSYPKKMSSTTDNTNINATIAPTIKRLDEAVVNRIAAGEVLARTFALNHALVNSRGNK
jgi:hypothetical protein